MQPRSGLPATASLSRLREITALFLKLGCIGFGGPQAHIAMMEDECVRRRRWLDHDAFLEGLGVCNMLPGPASTQLGIWIGYVRAGWPGAILAGLCFLLPAFLLLLAASWAYFTYRARWDLGAWFFGINAAVIALILHSCYRLSRSSVRRPWHWLLVGFGLAATLAGAEIALTLALAGLVSILVEHWAKQRVRPAGLAVAPGGLVALAQLAAFFLKVGAFIYGGGLVIIPFIQQEVVRGHGWLTAPEFADGVALGQVTPGPVVITAAFIGYRVAQTHGLSGPLGAMVATAAIFLPSFAFILAAAPFLKRVRRARMIQAFLAGVNPAVVGAILGATLPLAMGVLRGVGLPAIAGWLALVILALLALLRTRVSTPALVLVAAAIGHVVRMAAGS
ncbi:MAG: chromate efflux transporter [Armatimonadetes bacterium]|nr:chromate efflux transporter [Armatimonadota bacterium]